MTTYPELSRIEEEAAAWFVDTDRGLSEREAARFRAWLETSEEHARAWKRTSRMWASVDVSDPLVEAMRRDALEARASRSRLPTGLKVAAMTALLAAAGVTGWQMSRAPTSVDAPTVIARTVEPTFISGPSEKRSTTLPDGTRALLDQDTAITLAFTPGRRDLRLLRGQAAFDVQHDQARPFAVHAADTIVIATGTRFTVRTLQSGMVTTLDRGTVVISRGNDEVPVTLHPGEQVTAVSGSPMVVSSAKSLDAIARQSGYLEFNNTPLAQAVLQVNRFGNGVSIALAPDTSGLRVSGQFRLGDVDGFAEAATQVLPLRSERDATGAIKLSKH